MSLFDPAVIGVYGISGSGKSFALQELQRLRPEWRCLEGSNVIQQVLNEKGKTFEEFISMDEDGKSEIRNAAINVIGSFRGLSAIAGHIMDPGNGSCIQFEDVVTQGDLRTYKAIYYIHKSAEQIYEQRNKDAKRKRPQLSIGILKQWIDHEIKLLREHCDKHGIHFSLVCGHDDVIKHVQDDITPLLFAKSKKHSEQALRKVTHSIPKAHVYLLIDGDRTLSPNDTGKLFFDALARKHNTTSATDSGTHYDSSPLKQIFKRRSSYSFEAFLEVTMLYERQMSQDEYKSLSQQISKTIEIYPDWVEFLGQIPPNVQPILVSSGNREIWEAALTPSMSLLAGNHIGLHSYIVDSDAKAMVVEELRQYRRGCKIISFGDSEIDVPMLQASDRGYIVVDDRQNQSMNDFISKSKNTSSPLQQLCLHPSHQDHHAGIHVGCMASLAQELNDGTINSTFDCCKNSAAAKVLATQTRRADLGGPDLQRHHVSVGMLLAEKLMDLFPEQFVVTKNFPHVQGTAYIGQVPTDDILILPLMRGGEPMSRGVFDKFPHGKLVHFHNEQESTARLSKVLFSNEGLAVNNVVIVDSVVNEGTSVKEVIGLIQTLTERKKDMESGATILPILRPRIFVVTGVMQQGASLRLPVEYPLVRFLALRVSENKYKGKGGTDTGNRLFGTV